MSNILGKCVTQIDNADTSRIQGFACKPEIGELVEVMINGKFTNLEVCRITHKSEKTHNGYIPYIEVELTAKRQIL
jgi:hypothetical protein